MFKIPKVPELHVKIGSRGSRCLRCTALGFPIDINSHPDASSRRAHVKTHVLIDLDTLPTLEDPIFNQMMDNCFPHQNTQIPSLNAKEKKAKTSKKLHQVVSGRKGRVSVVSCTKCGFRPTSKNVSQEKLDHVLAKHANCRFLISCSLCSLGWHRKFSERIAEHFKKFHPGSPISIKDARERADVKRIRAECFPDRRSPKTALSVHKIAKEREKSKRPASSFTVRSKTCKICGFTLQPKVSYNVDRWRHISKKHAQSPLFSCGICGKGSTNDKGHILRVCKNRHPSQACQVVDNRPKLQKFVEQCFPLLNRPFNQEGARSSIHRALSIKNKYRGQGKRKESNCTTTCKLCGKKVYDGAQCRWGHVSYHHSTFSVFACPLCLFPGHRNEVVRKHLVEVHHTQNPKSVELIDRKGELVDVYVTCFP